MEASKRTVRISISPMTLEDIWAVAEGAPVELADDALERMSESRRVLDDAIDRGEAVYGVTTGVGHARDERIPVEALTAMQPILVEMHVGAMGEPLPTQRVRAAMAARLNGLTRGGAGASVALAEGIAALLNHGIHPVIPATGSVGAGDLGQLALLGRTLLGVGEVEVGGRRLETLEALKAANLEPVTLQPKDALALISSNAISIGQAALLIRRGERLMLLADLVTSVSMEAIRANPSPFDPAVASARASEGQVFTSEVVNRALSGSSRIWEGTDHSVQDPLSFRVVPQVHGGCRDVLASVARAATDELNAASDNPLVDVASGRILSNGNFQPMNLALVTESLRLALGHVGLLCERRMGHLWDAAVTSMGTLGPESGPSLADGQPPIFAGLALRYPAAALCARLRHIVQPVTLNVPPLDLGVEDHATNLGQALDRTDEAIDVLEEMLVVELLIAQLLHGPEALSDAPGAGTGPLRSLVEDELSRLPAGALPDEVHRSVRRRIVEGLGAVLEEGGLTGLYPR